VQARLAAAGPVTFGPDSAELTGPAAESVARAGELLAAEPAVRVAVDGFAADSPGPPEQADQLSARRAAAVADALIAKGVDQARIVAAGRGASRPLASRAASRRVEISAAG
jgi:outer membrane protein OmpA-like peptidoglycan-associated protein